MKRESEADPTDEELAKRPKMVTFEPEDLQREMMKFQNQKMSQKLKQRIRLEEELQKRVQQLEQRQTQDDALLCIINRHWNRLDEDVRILLQRFDAETSIESESQSESRATSSFLAELGHTEKREVDERLSSRVEFSRRAIGKLVQAFDRITQRNERIGHLLAEVRGGDDAEGARPEAEQAVSAERLNENVANLNIELQEENKKLQTVLTSLQKDNHLLAMRQSEADEQLAASQTRIAELQSQAEDLQYRLEKSGMREAKLDYALTELSRNSHKPALRGGKSKSGSPEVLQESSREGGGGADSSVSQAKADELTTELEEAREQSNNRLVELASLTERHKEALRDVDRLNLQLSHLPETVVVQTSEYKRLRAQYSVLHAESTKLMQQLEETRDHLTAAKIAHLRQIEQMESEELLAQKQLRSEMIHLEDQLGQVRREYEMLRVEFEQNLAANEQSGPLTKELRTLLASCKTQNQTLKADVTQFKSKWKTACSIIKDLEEQLEKERKKAHGGATGKDTPTSPGGSGEVEPGEISSPGRSESVVQDFKDQLRDLQRQLECAKHDDDASPSEQRLREELMSERIRSNQQQKMLNEEKDLITEQVVALQNQVEAQNLVVRKLEEKERLLQNTLATMDKELNLRQQVLEAHKRKAVESAQSGADLQLQLAKLQGQLDEAVGIVSEKTSSIEQEAFKYKRLQEEISILRRKLERAKKIEKASTADEVLFEEIRELKEQLTCPSCKVRRKDGILLKCHHVFCMECLRSRYETRQRKCPKCNCNFGANDFKRVYIT